MLNPDYLVERSQLKRQTSFWRFLFFAGLIIAIFIGFAGKLNDSSLTSVSSPSIARIKVEGIILENSDKTEILKDIEKNENIKAVIVHINSPGGTAVGGEVFYNSIKEISKKKPVVAVMSSMATSAAYLTALGTERIFARNATITGSIGVIAEIPNLKEAGDNIGLKFNYIKTSPLKGSPNLFEEPNEEALAVLRETMEDFYDYFVDVVATERNITRVKALKLADGRIFSAKAAIKKNLIDEIGSENDAKNWLIENKDISDELKIKDVSLEKPKTPLQQFMQSITKSFDFNSISEKYEFKGLSL